MKHARLSLVAPLVVLATTLSSGAAHGAEEIGLGATYDVRAPIGSLRDFASDVSFSGLQAKWDYFPLDALSVGLEAQYHLFQHGVETNTTSIPNGAVTAPTYRSASIWSFVPTVRYYLSSGTLRPYVALGAGVSSATSRVLVSDLSRRDAGVAFIVQPSIGVLWRLWSDLTPRPVGAGGDALPPNTGPARKPMESLVGLTASLAYAWGTSDVVGASNIGYVGIQLGVYAKP